MTSTSRDLRAALAAGRPVLGAWCTYADAAVAETLAGGGLDFVVLDAQHGTFAADRLADLVRAVEVGGAAPLVRTSGDTLTEINRAVDAGVAGVIVPLVEDADQAARVVAATRYPPHGRRSYGPVRPAAHPSRSDDALVIPMVETSAGLAAVDAIASTDGVGGVFVGNVDLAISLGLGLDGAVGTPQIEQALDDVVAAAGRHDRFVGGVARDTDHARDLLGRGLRLLTVAADKALLAAGVQAAVADLQGPDQPETEERR